MAAPQERAAANVATLTTETPPGEGMSEKLDAPSEEGAKTLTSGLSEHDKQIIDTQTDAPKLSVGYFALFRYANKTHTLIMVVSLIASIAAGAVMPLMTVSRSRGRSCVGCMLTKNSLYMVILQVASPIFRWMLLQRNTSKAKLISTLCTLFILPSGLL
jgi:hypothetical protein